MPLSASAEQALKSSLVADMQLTQLAQGGRTMVSREARPSPHERVLERNARAQKARATREFSRYDNFEHNLAKSAHVLGVAPSATSAVQDARASRRGLPSLRRPRTAQLQSELGDGDVVRALARPASASPASAAASEAEEPADTGHRGMLRWHDALRIDWIIYIYIYIYTCFIN